MSLAGKVALITGASKGIGKATALRLARDGASVVVNYSSDAKSADMLVHSIGVDKALAVKADVSKIPEIEKLVNQAIDKFGKIDILVPCAGILPMSPLESTTEQLFDEIFALNVKGPYFLVQVRAPHSVCFLYHTSADLNFRKRRPIWVPARTSSLSPRH